MEWSQGWQYPRGTLRPQRESAKVKPTSRNLAKQRADPNWRALILRPIQNSKHPMPTVEDLLGETISLTVGTRLSKNYFCGFRGAVRTHYALQFHDGAGKVVHGYVPRTAQSRELMDFIAQHEDVGLKVRGRVDRQTPSHECPPQLEILDWGAPSGSATKVRR